MGRNDTPMPEANWFNRTLWTGDNLQIMRGMVGETVALAYLDPPFNSKQNWHGTKGSLAEGATFKDTWGGVDAREEIHELMTRPSRRLFELINAAGTLAGTGMQSYLAIMAGRLLEVHRLLAPTGSLYVHCDSSASHYLKLLLDEVFGIGNFRADIIWKRQSAHNDSGRYGRIHDTLLYYTKGPEWTWNPVYTEHNPEYLEDAYRYVEEGTGRRYRLCNLTGPGGEAKSNPVYEVMGVTPPWRYTRENMDRLIAEGRVVQPRPGAVPRYKRYLDESRGVPLQDMWLDIQPVNSQGRERTGYPTQKPLALLERIIAVSSNPGDMVLDPFSGSGTTCLAAERLNRQWVGIDASLVAAHVAQGRLEEHMGLFTSLHHRTDTPVVTVEERETV